MPLPDRERSSRSIRLIEVLALIAITGIVSTLAINGIFYARESSRRNRCLSNMSHYGVALLQYHDRHGTFPAATGLIDAPEKHYNRYHYGSAFHLLPDIGETARYTAVVASEDPPHIDSFDTRLAGCISQLLCPADPNATRPGLFYGAARINIMTCRSDVAWHNNAGSLDIEHHRTVPPDARAGLNRAVFQPVWGLHGNRVLNTWKSRKDVTDGLRNTIALSEAVSTPEIHSRDIRGAVAEYIMMNHPVPLPPGACLNSVVNPENPTQIHPLIDISRVGRGNFFADGCPARSGFCTILPPNSPSCNNRPNSTNSPKLGWGVYSAGSNHVGGINVLYFDGSGQFLNDHIHAGNTGNVQAFDAVTPSPYGIWGALGTPWCGDDAALP